MPFAAFCYRLSWRTRRRSEGIGAAAPADKHGGMADSVPRMRIRPSPFRQQKAFTLIEMMVVVSVLAILLAFAVPSFRSTVASNRLTASTNELVSSIALARSEAIRRGVRVSMCKSANGAACTTAGTWSQGWIVFADTTRLNASAAVDAGETLIGRGMPVATDIRIEGSAGVANFVSFAADGTVRNMAGAASSGRLQVCSSASALGDANRARRIDITSAGRVATTSLAATVSCPAPT